jgi:hypothetical protein
MLMHLELKANENNVLLVNTSKSELGYGIDDADSLLQLHALAKLKGREEYKYRSSE